MDVSIIGAGYVGLVTGICLAARDHTVTVVEADIGRLKLLQRGELPIHEASLQQLFDAVRATRRFDVTADARRAVAGSEVTLIAVGTPTVDGRIDLQQIKAAAVDVGVALREKSGYHLVAVKSTVVPGTTEDVVRPILERCSGKVAGRDFGVAMNPEFLKEGEAVADFMEPDRIVIGASDDTAADALGQLYSVFPDAEVVRTTPRTAEMIKYTANALLATMISFSNEVGNLCARAGVDVVDVMRGVHLDRRLTPTSGTGERIRPGFLSYLEAGCGYGGSCFPKDVAALASLGEDLGVPMRILRSVIEVNANQPGQVVELLKRHRANLEGLHVAVLGLAFKPDTDDVRESPAVSVVRLLTAQGAHVTAYDPVARLPADGPFAGVQVRTDLGETIANADTVVLMTRWRQFEELAQLMTQDGQPRLLIDGRRMLDKHQFLEYAGIGLG